MSSETGPRRRHPQERERNGLSALCFCPWPPQRESPLRELAATRGLAVDCHPPHARCRRGLRPVYLLKLDDYFRSQPPGHGRAVNCGVSQGQEAAAGEAQGEGPETGADAASLR